MVLKYESLDVRKEPTYINKIKRKISLNSLRKQYSTSAWWSHFRSITMFT